MLDISIPKRSTLATEPLPNLTSTNDQSFIQRYTDPAGDEHYFLFNKEHGNAITRGEGHEQPDQMQILYYINDEEIVYKLSEYDEKGELLYRYLEKINTRTFERNILESTIGKWLGNDIKFNKEGTEFLFTGISENAIISTFRHNILTEETILIKEFSAGANWSNTQDAIVFTNLRINDGYLWIRYDSEQIVQLTSE